MIGDKITIFAQNVQGLHSRDKRCDVFNFLRKKKYSIICLTDTHFTNDQHKLIVAEWGYEVIFNSFNSNSRGIAVLLNNSFEYKIFHTYKDCNGNSLLLDMQIDEHRLTLAVIYGPNKDDPSFFETLQRNLVRMGNKNIIVTGDFNILLNPLVDGKNYKNINNPNARNKLLKMISDLNLYDIYRDENPLSTHFTWKRKLKSGGVQMGRLDYFLVSEELTNFSRDEKIIYGYRSDHSAIVISLVFNEIVRSKTFWKFNNSLLNNSDFINEIKQVISKVKKQYAALPYNLDNIESIENETFQTVINPQLFLDILLLEIRSTTVSFSSALKKKENNTAYKLESEIQILENEDPVENFDVINLKQEELKTIREKKLKGTLIRSKARWVEHSEKPSRYFCNLENRNFISKRMKSLIDKNENVLTDFNAIKNEVLNFYSKLYESKEDTVQNVNLDERLGDGVRKLMDNEANSLEGLITIEEAAVVLNNMKNNKSPGSSGFTAEFFKFFWLDLRYFVVRSINYGFSIKELSATQKEGIITCIPKKDKDKKYIKNWRPISLLNVTYKIASGCIANRIKSVLPSIISYDQCGFMSNRSVADNIRLLYDILYSSLEQKKPGLLLLIDFEKAFDSVAWSFIKKALVFFNFKSDIIHWIEFFYKNIKSTVIVNNAPTPWFPILRGCRQGDPISPYIFLT